MLRDGKPVTAVALGEELELRWEIVRFREEHGGDEKVGYFIDTCLAERLDGPPPDPEPLVLIQNGICFTTKAHSVFSTVPQILSTATFSFGSIEFLLSNDVPMRSYVIGCCASGFSTKIKVFRFDGSRRVRLRCSINVCVERCKPVNCDIDAGASSSSSTTPSLKGVDDDENAGVTVESFGKRRRRRRRRQTLRDLSEMVRKFKPNHQTTIATRNENENDDVVGQMIEQDTVAGSYTIIESSEVIENENGFADESAGTTAAVEAVTRPTVSQMVQTAEPTSKKCTEGALAELSKLDDRVCILRHALISLIVVLLLIAGMQIYTLVHCVYARSKQKRLESACSRSYSESSYSSRKPSTSCGDSFSFRSTNSYTSTSSMSERDFSR
ncbi:hypothetical protein L596_005136 [Steinernema carpocapsae]|uniref:ZP domain-containing protein n=1 Tax=Steinernema carpocapsae TaxID=34508 RepID=A0A4U8UYA1_STECR|nr:hypothetical protein L596_005136 [Steinernema carpocapsae]